MTNRTQCPSHAGANRLNSECRLSLGAAIACLLVGAGGWAVNHVSPGSTTLGALLAVGVFYLLLGLGIFVTEGQGRDEPSDDDILARHSAAGIGRPRSSVMRHAGVRGSSVPSRIAFTAPRPIAAGTTDRFGDRFNGRLN